jgi:outer membrane protein assembly factor BamB
MKKIYLLFLLLIIFESCNNKKVEPITPIANFSFELGKNGEVKFINTSQNASKFQWEFGDGESSTEMNPIHTYKTENVYKVKLIVNSDEKNKNEIIQEINITNFTPKASFEYSIGENGLTKFKNTSINSKTFAWSFGDGNRSTEANPTHAYNANPKYNIKLIATNSNSKDSTQSEIQISNVVSSTNVFICDDNGTCSLLSSTSGALIWQYKTDKFIWSSPTYYQNTLFISTSNLDFGQSRIIALDYQTGLKKWEFNTSQVNHSSPIVVDEKLYSLSYNPYNKGESKLYCLDIKNGTVIWEESSANFEDSSPTYNDGFIYVVSKIGLEIFDAQNGKRNKSLRVSQLNSLQDISSISTSHSSPAIHKGMCYYAFQKSLFSYNIQTKQLKRIEFELNSSSSSPTIENDVVYVNDEGNLYAVNASNFTKKWVFKSPKRDSEWLSSPLAVGDIIFTVIRQTLYAINAQTGTEKWTIGNNVFSSPNYYDSIVYIATSNELKALHSITGNLIWSFKLKQTSLGISSPLIINSKGEAFHSSISGAKQ